MSARQGARGSTGRRGAAAARCLRRTQQHLPVGGEADAVRELDMALAELLRGSHVQDQALGVVRAGGEDAKQRIGTARFGLQHHRRTGCNRALVGSRRRRVDGR